LGEALALLAALAFATGTVLQQKGALTTEAAEDDPRFLVQILHQPIWLAGAAAQGFGWVLQAAALDRAPLTVVQALTALSLVMALPLGVRLTHQHVGSTELVGAGLTLAGLLIFLSGGQPQHGKSHPSAASWWAACLVTLVAVLILVALGRRFRGAGRALTLGAAAGLAFGLQAAVTKTFVADVGHGLVALLSSWSVYALIVSAICGFVLQQSALKTGVLAPAMASSNSVALLSSVVLAVTVYDEKLAKSGAVHAGAAWAGLGMAIVGIVLLAGSEPPSTTSAAGTGG
jgi:drug/metabolite transporter (DMT)-like permease